MIPRVKCDRSEEPLSSYLLPPPVQPGSSQQPYHLKQQDHAISSGPNSQLPSLQSQVNSTTTNSSSSLPLTSNDTSLPLSTISQRFSYPSNDISHPRNMSQRDIPFQFPSNPVYFNTPNYNNNNNNNGHETQYPNPNYQPVATHYPHNSPGTGSLQNRQVLPQLNFPTNNSTSNTAGTGSTHSSFSAPGTSGPSVSSTPSSYLPNYNNTLSGDHPPFHTSRSHSYGGDIYYPPSRSHHLSYSQDIHTRSYLHQQETHELHANPDYQAHHMPEHKPETFLDEDIRVLKSLLFNGERVKWRYISSKLSSVSGRRATATACSKRTRELFKLPSEKNAGSLGTSLPYVIHDAWNQIIEDEP